MGDRFWIGSIAGLAGDRAIISDCSSSLKITATAADEVIAGGIAGVFVDGEGSKIENCHTTGDISAVGAGGETGGIVGHLEASI